MASFIDPIKRKVSKMICTLVCSGVVLLMLAVLIIWTDFVLRLVVGIIVIIVAFVFFYGAHKLWLIKKDVEKYFKL